MSKYVIDEKTLTDIAGSIRAKKGDDAPILTENFAKEIGEIGNKELSELIERTATHIDIPEGITKIGTSAFFDYYSLTSITIPDSVRSIGDKAFQSCKALKSITIPDSVRSMGYSVFNTCEALKSITIPDSVRSIGNFAFNQCSGLERVDFGSGVTSIGDKAFQLCTSCREYDFSDFTSVPELGTNVFAGINENAKIIVPTDLHHDWHFSKNWRNWQSNIVSMSKCPITNSINVSDVWTLEIGTVGSEILPVKAYCRFNDNSPLEFHRHSSEEWSIYLSMYTWEENGITWEVASFAEGSGPYMFTQKGTYEIWIQDGNGKRLYWRILEVTE